MGAALLHHRDARFAAGLALGLALSLVMLLAGGGDQPIAGRGIRHVSEFSFRNSRGRYDEIFKGIEELAAVWGTTSCARGIYIDVGTNVVRAMRGFGGVGWRGAGRLMAWAEQAAGMGSMGMGKCAHNGHALVSGDPHDEKRALGVHHAGHVGGFAQLAARS